MITANNITDAHIRDLMAFAESKGWNATATYCRVALYKGSVLHASRVLDARRRCAEVIRMRKEGAA